MLRLYLNKAGEKFIKCEIIKYTFLFDKNKMINTKRIKTHSRHQNK